MSRTNGIVFDLLFVPSILLLVTHTLCIHKGRVGCPLHSQVLPPFLVHTRVCIAGKNEYKSVVGVTYIMGGSEPRGLGLISVR